MSVGSSLPGQTQGWVGTVLQIDTVGLVRDIATRSIL